MFPRSSLVVLVMISCIGGTEPHDPSTPGEGGSTCPSDSAPEKCQQLADAAASAGHVELAWAYTVLDCESPRGPQCSMLWQRYAKNAPTQTDALNVLHIACARTPTACQQLAAWHRERGHVLAAAAYEKRAAGKSGSEHDHAVALSSDLAAIMHASSARPHTDMIAQMVGHALRAPTLTKPQPKAWPTHAASHISNSDACNGAAILDRHQVSLDQCIGEVRPIETDQVALRNRCNRAITVSYAGAGANQSPYSNKIRLEAYEARSLGVSHQQVGELTFAACADDCVATTNPDDVSSPWKSGDGLFYCSGGARR